MPSFQFQDRSNKEYWVPAGDYVLGVEKAELGLAKTSGNEQITLTCRVMLESGKGEGPNVYDYLQFDEKNSWKIDVVLKALKSQPKKGEVVDVTEAWLKQHFVGKLGWATLYVDEYNGKKSSKITAWITNPKTDAYQKFAIVGDQQDAKAEDDFK